MANIRAWFGRTDHTCLVPNAGPAGLRFAHINPLPDDRARHDLPAAEHAQGMPPSRTRESLPPVLRTIILLAVIGVALAALSAGLLALIGPVR